MRNLSLVWDDKNAGHDGPARAKLQQSYSPPIRNRIPARKFAFNAG
jgi:hypothetical protein